MHAFAIIDPAAGAAGGVLALSIFVVGPIALLLHFLVRRFFIVTLLMTGVFTLFWLGVFVYFGDFALERRSSSFHLVWLSLVSSLVVSLIAGVPAVLVRFYNRRREKKHDVVA